MQVLKTVQNIETEGLLLLLGQVVTLFCDTYIYTGELVGVNETCVKLNKGTARIVYETGELTSKVWKDAQSLPNDWYVMTSKIEGFGILK
jgi:hypothetical protein